VSIISDAILVSGNTISLIAATASDGEAEIPASWVVGTVITVVAPDSFRVVNTGGYSVIYGNASELLPVVGMPVSVTFNESGYDLFVASYAPGVPAVPGVGGSTASITASAAPTTYDFTATPVTFTIGWKGTTYAV